MQLSTLGKLSEFGHRTALHAQGFKNPDLDEENLHGTLSDPPPHSLPPPPSHTPLAMPKAKRARNR